MPVRRWRLGSIAHGQRVALAPRGGSIELPLTEPQATAARGIAFELVGAPDEEPSRRTVKIGGRKAGTVEVVPGRVWHALDVAPGLLAAGENTIVIEGGGFIAVEFACLLQRLGVQVTLVYRGELVLRRFDENGIRIPSTTLPPSGGTA
ncbi:MAG: hypothetical protein F9K40_14390 [Kofleriaceae bacterium]|nr:MAG: hypothetical protein F9K40_14390 [Kofleriaceae bacterium]